MGFLHRRRRTLESARGLRRDLPALAGLVVLFGTVVGAGIVSNAVGTLQRSAEAPVQVIAERYSLPPAATFRMIRAGAYLRYEYTVDGVSYVGTAFRHRAIGDEEQLKVCFDPGDPSDHRLVEASIRCGSW